MSRKTTLRRTIGILGALAIGILPGCGDYSKSTREAREEFYAGEYSDAARSLEKGAREEGVDQLLYVLDRATALHHAGSYEESNQEFHLADKLSEIKDYTSLSAETATLITNDKIIPYKGEDFERVLISQYLALNYLMLGKKEDALVECRRVNHKLHMMISQGKRKYKLNPMAMYVAALLYEDAGEWSDAYVDYQQVYKLMPELSYLREDLYRLAAKNRMPDHQRRWAEAFNLSVEEQKRILEEASRPELVMIFELGRGPEKQPHRAFPSIPQFVPRYDSSNYADVFLEDGRSEAHRRPLLARRARGWRQTAKRQLLPQCPLLPCLPGETPQRAAVRRSIARSRRLRSVAPTTSVGSSKKVAARSSVDTGSVTTRPAGTPGPRASRPTRSRPS